MKFLSKILIIALPVLILVFLGFGGAQFIGSLKPPPSQADEVPKGLAVFAEPVVRTALDLKISTQGEVRPKREISVAPQISGRIAYVSPDFEEGGFIKRGEVLVRLESADYELAKVRAESAVASAQQNYTREVAESELARQEIADLGITDATPLALREPQLADARAALDAARSQLRDAELALSRTEVRAPFDGRVRSLAANIGQFVGPGQSLGQIFATDVVEIVLPLTDSELGLIGLSIAFEESEAMPGPRVDFTAAVAGRPRRWSGHITRTAAAIDPRTRLISAIAEVADPYGKGADDGMPMAPGLFVDAVIEGRSLPDVLRIPRQALRNLDEVYVYETDTGTLSIRKVSVVYSDDDGAYIVGGLDAGEMAIISPMQSVFDGMKITLAQRGAGATGGDSAPAAPSAEPNREGGAQ